MNKSFFCGALLCALFAAAPAEAQSYRDLGNTAVPGVVPLAGCSPGGNCAGPVSPSNPLPVIGTFSATLGGFQPSASGARMTPLPVTASDSSGPLPNGAVVVVSNVGANSMYCNVNGVAATASDELIPINSWFAFTIPSGVTALHCIGSGGSTTANGVGGSGLATGAGGESSGGGGGASSSFGSSFPLTGTAIGLSNGTDMEPLLLGSQTSANSAAVVIASDQAAVAAKLNATPSLANGNGVVPTQGGSVLSATNGGYSNLLQGNAALSATNGLYADLLQGNAVLSATNPIFAQLTTATTVIGQADNAAWTEGTTPQIPLGCEYTSGGATALTTAHVGTPGCTSARGLLTDKSSVAGTALVAATSAYGTAPTGTQVEGVNAYVTNSIASVEWNADGVAATQTGSPTTTALFGYNGTTWDRLRDDSNKYLYVDAIGTVTSQVSTNNTATTPHICGSHVFKHITTATDTQIVAASGSENIYICDYSLSFNGTGNFYLEKATSGTCATLTQIDQDWYGVANGGKIAANPYYQGLNTGSSAQLCANTSAAIAVDVAVNYDQY